MGLTSTSDALGEALIEGAVLEGFQVQEMDLDLVDQQR